MAHYMTRWASYRTAYKRLRLCTKYFTDTSIIAGCICSWLAGLINKLVVGTYKETSASVNIVSSFKCLYMCNLPCFRLIQSGIYNLINSKAFLPDLGDCRFATFSQIFYLKRVIKS